MAQLQEFPHCCGAQILTGLYADGSGADASQRASVMPTSFAYFTVAITNEAQHENAQVVKALRDKGFEPVLVFTGNGYTDLHLWARGRNWKPIAGAKGNMKRESEEAFEQRVEKEVAKRVKAISLEVSKKLKLSRQPAGRGTRRAAQK